MSKGLTLTTIESVNMLKEQMAQAMKNVQKQVKEAEAKGKEIGEFTLEVKVNHLDAHFEVGTKSYVPKTDRP